jgi:biotin carboxyl carrier protein
MCYNSRTEQLEIIGGKIVDSAGCEYMYDNVKNELLDDAKPKPAVVKQPPLAFRVREVKADATTAATAAAVTAATAAAAGTGATPVPAPTPVTMVLTPFVANTSTINYQSKASAKLWKQSSKGL